MSRRWRGGAAKLDSTHRSLAIATFKVSSDSVRLLDAAARAPVAEAEDAWVGDYSDVVANAAAGVASPVGGNDLCGNQPVRRVHDNSSLSHFSAMARPSWLGRAVGNEHHHAIEQASRRWRDFHTGIYHCEILQFL